MSDRLLFLLTAYQRARRAGKRPLGMSDRDWRDAQVAVSRMPGRSRLAEVVPLRGRPDRSRAVASTRARVARAAS